MAKQYDVIVVGAGHNGLLVAAYLAKAGEKVCVVERLDYIGGGAVTVDGLTGNPGYKMDICSAVHGVIQTNPLIKNDELSLLSKYGLKYLYPELQNVMIYQDNTHLDLYMDIDKTCASIAKFSQKDAESYRKFYEWSLQTLDMLEQGLHNPPPPFGTFMSMLQESKVGRELGRAMMLSALDIIHDWFENEKVIIGLTRYATELMIKPQTKGTGLVFYLMIPTLHKYGGGMPVGGSGVLSEAIERCLVANGGEVKVSSPVKRFKVEQGECKGVILESGEEILASKAVVANLHVTQVYNKMLSENELPAGLQDKVSRIAPSDFQLLKVDLALGDKQPMYKVSDEINKTFWVEFCPAKMDEYLRYFDELSYGIMPGLNPVICIPTANDPSRAPKGKQILYSGSYYPYFLRDGGPEKWDEIKDRETERYMDFLRKHMTNLDDSNIVGRFTMSPLDLERHNNAMVWGDYGSIGAFLHQSFGNRPMPEWNYRTPVNKLYMCGPSCHPGMAVSGGGRAAVQVVMEDLDIDFEKVTS